MERKVSLKKLSSFRIGGEAEFFLRPKNISEISEAVIEAKQKSIPLFILGGSTNILWPDDGFEGLIIKPVSGTLEFQGDEVTAGAGILISELLPIVLSRGLSGLEWAGGLPGTLGGAIRGNAGAFGGETKDSIKEVVSFDMDKLEVIKRDRNSCSFDYRTSVFKTKGNEIILEATLALKPGNKETIQKEIEGRVNYRRERHPMEHPNVGSIFKNVPVASYKNLDLERFKKVIKQDPFPVIPTAFLIAETGLKGVSCGGAMISPKHPNFIVNVLDAEAQDVKDLINLVKMEVYDKFDIKLEEEILILPENPS